MPSRFGTSLLSIGTDNRPLEKGLDEAEKLSKSFVTRLSAVLGSITLGPLANEIKTGMAVATGAIGAVIDGLGKVGLAIQGVQSIASTLKSVGGFLTSGNAQFEDYNVQFSTLIKNSDDFKRQHAGVTNQLQLEALATQGAKDKMAELAKFGAETPFDLPQVVEAQRVLMGFGLAAENAKDRFGQSGSDILTISGDVASGTGTDFREIARYIGQFSSGSTGEAIARFQELGITTRAELTKMGLVFDKGGALIVKNQEEMDRATSILLQVMKNKYGGLMDAQSATFNGMLSNLGDWIDGTIRQVSQPLYEPAKAGLKAFLDYVNSPAGLAAVDTATEYVQKLVDFLTAAFKKLSPEIKPTIDRVREFAETIQTRANPVLDEVTPKLKYFWATFGPIITVIYQLVTAFSPLTLAFIAFKGFLDGGVMGALAALGNHFKGLADLIENGFTRGLSIIKTNGPLLVSWVAPLARELLSRFAELASKLLAWIGEQAGPLLDRIQTWATVFIDWVIPIAGQLARNLMKMLAVVLKWVEDNASTILNQLATWAVMFVKWILPVIPQLIQNLSGLLNQIFLWVTTSAPRILSSLLVWAQQFIAWIKPMIGWVMATLQELIATIINWVAENGPVIINQLLDWAMAFLGWIDPLVPLLINALSQLIATVLGWVAANAPAIMAMALGWVNSILNAIDTLLPLLQTALGVIIGAVLNWIAANGPRILTMFLDWANSFINWIGPMIPLLLKALGALIVRVFQWIKDNGPAILDTLLNWAIQFIDWAVGLFDQVKPYLMEFIGKVLAWMAERGPELLDKLWGWIQQSINIAQELFVYITPLLFDLIGRLGTWIAQNTPYILDTFWSFFKTGADIISNIMQKMTPILLDIVSAIGVWAKNNSGQILDTFWSFFKTGLDVIKNIMIKMEPILSDLINAVGDWIARNAPDILDKFWDFFKTGLNVITAIMWKIEPTLSKIIEEIGIWISNNARDILNKFWDFFNSGIRLITTIMTKVEPVLFKIITEIGLWITNNAEMIVKQFFGFFTWITLNAAKVVNMLIGPAMTMMNALMDAMVKQSDTLVKGLVDGIMASVKANPEAWAKVGEFMIGAMFGPLGIAGVVALEYLKSKSMSYNPSTPIDNLKKPPGGIPVGHATGVKNSSAHTAWVGEAGPELVRLKNIGDYLVTKATLMDLPAGSDVMPLNFDRFYGNIGRNVASYNPGSAANLASSSSTTNNNNNQKTERNMYVTVRQEDLPQLVASFNLSNFLGGE